MIDTAQLVHRRLSIPAYFAAPVIIEAAEVEANLVYLRVRTEAGRLEELVIAEAELLEALQQNIATNNSIVSAASQFLLVEAERIRLAYTYDPYFAVSLSGVEPLPHQLEAVYERMLPQARLRFLLADDPGAGKTIMAGLLIKELKMRDAVERVLILCPAPLTIQWQDELRTKFDETFEVIRSELAKDQLAGNVWTRFPRCIASIDFAKQDDIVANLLRADWDLVIIDEAHKCAARRFGTDVKRTRRYILAEALSAQAERLLLLTATPHSGDAEQFAYFLRLLDSDQFVGPDRVDDYAELNQQALIPRGESTQSPWFLRRLKEELRDFDGQKLFTQRHPVTVPFDLSFGEKQLYDSVTEYINTYLPRQSGRKKGSVALARTVLQRRLASSVRAIHKSLGRRYERFNTVLREVNALPMARQEQYLRVQNLLEAYDDEQDTDDADDLLNDLAATTITAAERITDLIQEVNVLGGLVTQARQLEESGDERKLHELLRCLERAEFSELHDGRGKLLIFTEHRDTLDYLHEQLQSKYTIVEIHGGMNAQARKAAQERFRADAQICLATEAAGEGINLQFCHLMINYDIPWNPVRLEQRMGRVHRIGQKLDVYIFNFVTNDTIEGRILRRLMDKLDQMRVALGDRVFDVIGMVLRVNDIDLESMLREAAYNPRHITDDFYVQQIEHIEPERLRDLEQATGVAMATSHVDLSHIQAQDFRSEEQRLMPEYVEKYFLAAALALGVRVEQRADGLYRVEHVPQKLRATSLRSAKRFGSPESSYRKLTFRKHDILRLPQHADAELLSPGHPLFTAVSEVLESRLANVRGGMGVYYDAVAQAPYYLHFFIVELIGEEPAAGGYRSMPQYARLSAILETPDGTFENAPPDVLHDLQPAGEDVNIAQALDPETHQRLLRWVKGRQQREALDEQRTKRERDITIRQDYLERTFESLLNALRRKEIEAAERVVSSGPTYRIAHDDAQRRVDELEARRDKKLDDLKHLRVLRPGAVQYLGSAEVRPANLDVISASSRDAMHSDPEVERRAMEHVMQHEHERGWQPFDISQKHDGSGFDIRSISPADTYGRRDVRRIEVKGRSGYNMPVALTPNEWLQAGRHTDSYWLYVVWGAGTGQTPQLLKIQNPAAQLAARSQAIVKHYLLPADALAAVAED